MSEEEILPFPLAPRLSSLSQQQPWLQQKKPAQDQIIIHTEIELTNFPLTQKEQHMLIFSGTYQKQYINLNKPKQNIKSLQAHHSGTLSFFFTSFIFKNIINLQHSPQKKSSAEGKKTSKERKITNLVASNLPPLQEFKCNHLNRETYPVNNQSKKKYLHLHSILREGRPI